MNFDNSRPYFAMSSFFPSSHFMVRESSYKLTDFVLQTCQSFNQKMVYILSFYRGLPFEIKLTRLRKHARLMQQFNSKYVLILCNFNIILNTRGLPRDPVFWCLGQVWVKYFKRQPFKKSVKCQVKNQKRYFSFLLNRSRQLKLRFVKIP